MARLIPDTQFASLEPGLVLPNAGSSSLPVHQETIARTLRKLEDAIRTTQAAIQQLAAGLDAQLITLTEHQRALSSLPALITHPPHGFNAPAFLSHLNIYCFGRFQVFQDGKPIQLHGSGKGGLILKYLVMTMPHPVHRDVLLEALWPETAPEIANNRLKAVMHHLRKTLSPDNVESTPYIHHSNGCYAFSPEVQIWADVPAFEEIQTTARRLERAGHLNEAISLYLEAKNLYRGDFLEEDRYEEWTLLRREQLKDTYLTVLDRLSTCWLKTGQPDRAIEAWKLILTLDPWREDIYRHLMMAEAGTGNRAAALHLYDRCKQVLEEEYSIGPEPETRALYERICTGEDFHDCLDD